MPFSGPIRGGARHRALAGRPTESHAAAGGAGRPLAFRLSAGHVAAITFAPDLVAAAMARWRRSRAQERLAVRLEEISERLRIPASRRPRLSLRAMRTRWASLSPSGMLSVNPDLIRAPVTCIDYVLVHELCHLECPHHGPAFWRLLSRRMPDWPERKARLERMLA